MWNGMVLLPVLLSWVGPPPYLTAYIPLTSDTPTSTTGQDNPALDKEPDTNYMVNGYMNSCDVPHSTPAQLTASQSGPRQVKPTPSRLPRHKLVWDDCIRNYIVITPRATDVIDNYSGHQMAGKVNYHSPEYAPQPLVPHRIYQ